MKKGLKAIGVLVVGYCLAHFFVLLFNNWYFADNFWLKVALLTPVFGLTYQAMLSFSWRRLWLFIGWWWVITHVLAMVPAGGYDLRKMEFVAVLDYEFVVLFLPGMAIFAMIVYQAVVRRAQVRNESKDSLRSIRLRAKLRQAATEPSIHPVTNISVDTQARQGDLMAQMQVESNVVEIASTPAESIEQQDEPAEQPTEPSSEWSFSPEYERRDDDESIT